MLTMKFFYLDTQRNFGLLRSPTRPGQLHVKQITVWGPVTHSIYAYTQQQLRTNVLGIAKNWLPNWCRELRAFYSSQPVSCCSMVKTCPRFGIQQRTILLSETSHNSAVTTWQVNFVHTSTLLITERGFDRIPQKLIQENETQWMFSAVFRKC
jgi:hypothetical protein